MEKWNQRWSRYNSKTFSFFLLKLFIIKGKYYSANGEIYSGSFKEDKRNG